MIKKFLKRLLTKNEHTAGKVITNHNIDKSEISANALNIIDKLQNSGFEAYIVGGAVRDLLLGIKPKDFDVATNATPVEINKLFHKSRIIGKRFQIVLVPFYRARVQEVIEITTFRAALNTDEFLLVDNQSNRQAIHHKVAIDSSGQVWSDNVWGSHAEDASRRDFTINALYYEPNKNVLYDFYNGLNDLKSKSIKVIGEPALRYKEDPVRILRISRFVARTDFTIEKNTLEPIKEHVHLLNNIPFARLSDELLKMLMGGYAQKCVKSLKDIGADKYILPWHNITNKANKAFIDLVLYKTDERLAQSKSVSPSFIFSAIYWPLLVENWNNFKKTHPPIESLHLAITQTISSLQMQRRVIADMQEIWLMQPNLEKRLKSKIFKLLEHNKFRAAYDFLVLRSIIDPSLKELADWWTAIQEVDKIQQELMINNIKASSTNKKKKKRVYRRKSKPIANNETK